MRLSSFSKCLMDILLSSFKEINRLISKGMLYIYLKVTNEKNWRSQNFDFPSLKNSSSNQFLRSSRRHHWILKLPFCNLKIRSLGAKACVAFLLFWFWKELLHIKFRDSMLFVEKKNKHGMELKNKKKLRQNGIEKGKSFFFRSKFF